MPGTREQERVVANSLQFGLTLPNRGVSFGLDTMGALIDMGIDAEESGLFQTLWVGDNLMARRRPESIVVLSALASRTHRVRLGAGCMASFPVRDPVILAAQWATVDMVAGPGRLILAACTGGRRGGGDWEMEQRAFGIPQGQRLRRLEEGIEALRALWAQERATYRGDFVQFIDVVSEPQPVTCRLDR